MCNDTLVTNARDGDGDGDGCGAVHAAARTPSRYEADLCA
jgi:hypothetical protein